MRIRLALLAYIPIAACAHVGDPDHANKSDLSSSCSQAEVLASQDFSKKISTEKQYDELGKFLSEINNYNLNVYEEPQLCRIVFSPKRYRGRSLSGGGAEYVVRKDTNKFIERKFFK